ncbi:MAG TPA: type II toxin-antitoxin system death-on-curing family toxin [Polyangiales bacterium]|nr:type II toxin-antitoxin system death-on-curing family toxin [Polyangiales bacterium]
MDATLYLTLDEVLTLHAALLARHGGASGVRDLGLVESALARARSGYYESLSEQAAALLQSFAMNHAFIDGNKRVAWASTMVFLRMNGYRVRVSADDAEHFLIDDVITGRAEVAPIAKWLERFMRAV